MSKFQSILQFSKNIIKRPAESNNPNPPKEFKYKLKKWAFNVSNYNKFGLYSDDIINDEMLEVKEALRRLPKDVLDARNFRLIRGCQLDFLKMYLPKEKWITYEQDLEYRYLKPYIEEVIAEMIEIHEFGCVNYSKIDWGADEV